MSQLNKQQVLESMIEDELTLKEPKFFMRYLLCFWGVVGTYAFYQDFLDY